MDEHEILSLRRNGEFTLLEERFPARESYELWIDQRFFPHYRPECEAGLELKRIAAEQVILAEKALRAGDFDQALRHGGAASSADNECIEPLAIKAAVRRLQGNHASEALMAELASAERDYFDLMLGRYLMAAAAKVAPVGQSR